MDSGNLCDGQICQDIPICRAVHRLEILMNNIDIEKKAEIMLEQVFKNILPQSGYVFRDNQLKLAQEILKTMQDVKIAVCESEVGTGKTHAYILAAIVNKIFNKNYTKVRNAYPISKDYYKSYNNMPILLSTSSIVLQKAIMNDYIPEISNILMKEKIINKPLTAVIRKGKEHYICDKRLDDCVYNIDKEKHLDVYKNLISLRALNYKRIDLDEISIPTGLKSKICVSANCNCLCHRYEDCRYNMLLNSMKSYEHDFQICNHNYFFADAIRRSAGQEALIPNYSALIIDEAHKLVDISQTMYGTKINKKDLESLRTQIKRLSFKSNQTGKSINKAGVELLNLTDELFGNLKSKIPGRYLNSDEVVRYKTNVSDNEYLLINEIIGLLEDIEYKLGTGMLKNKGQNSILSHVKRQIKDLKNKFSVFLNISNIIYWLESENLKSDSIYLCAIPKDINKKMHKDLWSRNIPIILTSGTLSANRDFSLMKSKLGLDIVNYWRISSSIKNSPFDYKNNCLIYLNDKLPFPDSANTEYIKAVADEVYKLIYATKGHTMVLFTSYPVMEKVYSMIYDKLRRTDKNHILVDKLFRAKKGAYSDPINTFKESRNGVLFAAGNCWEGIDITGDILSSLIIVKLPFSAPDTLTEYQRYLYDNDSDFFERLIIPQMIIKLKQGCGRLIRNETDSGVISILDCRMDTYKRYRDKVLTALPDCRVTSQISVVESFIADKKNMDYFKTDIFNCRGDIYYEER